MLSGVLCIDKPAGMGSTDVVRRVRRLLNMRKVGHAGTLDPDATGVLLVCVGEGTKAVPFLTAAEKVYTATARLGAETLTDDAAGEIIATAEVPETTRAFVETALRSFVGSLQQIPPRVSAIKKDGRRMYERVRAGEDVDAQLEPRAVVCHSLSLTRFAPPELDLEMCVGKGFYVRSLVRDLGRLLGTAAHVLRLRRLRVGRFEASAAIPLEAVTPERLISVAEALAHLPRLRVSGMATADVRCGRPTPLGEHARLEGVESPVPAACAIDETGRLAAIVSISTDQRVRVIRGFSSAYSG